MKKMLFFLMSAFILSSCGNDGAMKTDVKKLVDLKCKGKQQFDKIMELNKKMQSIPQPNPQDMSSFQTYADEQKKIMDELATVKKEDNKLADEYKKLEKEMKEKYKSESDKEKLKKELSEQLLASNCK